MINKFATMMDNVYLEIMIPVTLTVTARNMGLKNALYSLNLYLFILKMVKK